MYYLVNARTRVSRFLRVSGRERGRTRERGFECYRLIASVTRSMHLAASDGGGLRMSRCAARILRALCKKLQLDTDSRLSQTPPLTGRSKSGVTEFLPLRPTFRHLDLTLIHEGDK